MSRPPSPLGSRLLEPLERFFHVESNSGFALLGATLAALMAANSPWAAAFAHLWEMPVSLGLGSLVVTQTIHFWVNEGLMTIFFLLVGLEIRREMHEGALASLRAAALPLVAASGGVLVPGLVYLTWNATPETSHGWAIPTATDIAFAIGALTLLGPRVPPGLRVLLLAIAVIDDIIAIGVIAFFYSDGIATSGLLVAGSGIAGVLAFQRIGVRHALLYTVPGAIVWAGFLTAGVHPALAGVVLGLLTPVVPLEDREAVIARAGRSLDDISQRLNEDEHDIGRLSGPVQTLRSAQRDILPPVVRVQLAIHPWVAFGIMPLFALANAGIGFNGLTLEAAGATSVLLGVVCGLIVGKPVGIALAALLSIKLRLGILPPGVSLRGLIVVGCLAGIGFTMSIFIATLAFSDPSLLGVAKLAILLASAGAAVVGLFVGWWLLPNSKQTSQR